jgi:hypothetical protein
MREDNRLQFAFSPSSRKITTDGQIDWGLIPARSAFNLFRRRLPSFVFDLVGRKAGVVSGYVFLIRLIRFAAGRIS